jgi:hypothetical protein
MKWNRVATIAGLSFVLPVVGQSPKQAPKKEVREVIATGCVLKGVEANCLLVKTLDGNTVYNIYAKYPPEPGTVITFNGGPHNGPSACMEGLAVDVASWQATGEKCSK